MKSRNYRSQVAQPALRPVVTVDHITDPTAAGENFELLDQDAVQLEAGAFRAKRVAVRLAGSTVVYQSTQHRLRVRTRVPPGLVAIVTLGPRSRGSLDGLALSPELLLAGEPGVEVELVVEPRYESVSFLLSPEELTEHLRARGHADEFRVPHGVEMWHHGTIGVRGLFKLGKRMTETAARNPERFNHSAHARTAAHIEVLESLMAALGTGEVLRLTRRDRTRKTYSRIVKVVQGFALDRIGEGLHVTDLCKAAGVSERTLQGAFQEILGMTPIACLRRLRLHRVRQALRAASYGSTTVATHAVNWGFWHFGEFSRAYKDCFGELPSETLRRRP